MTLSMDWIRATGLPARVRSIWTPMANSLAAATTPSAPPVVESQPIQRSLLDDQDNLQLMRSKWLLFLACSLSLIGVAWLGVSLSLYTIGGDYHAIALLYESRWLASTIIFCALTAFLLCYFKYETFHLGCAFFAVYNCASCSVVLTMYAINYHKSLYRLIRPLAVQSNWSRKKYLQLCGCMVVTALLGLLVGLLLLIKLWQLASRYYTRAVLHRTQRSYLLLSAVAQLPLVCFSIYVTSHVISLPTSLVQQYMVQELLCALILKSLLIVQVNTFLRPNRLTLKLLLLLNACQTLQEIFYTWNSYYISLYIQSSKAKVALGVETDQYLMSANFVGHFVRMCLAAYTTYQLSLWLRLPQQQEFTSPSYCRLELSRGVRQMLVWIAACALLMAAVHVGLDVVYATSSHIYRSIVAFTGISLFYLSLIGVTLAFFARSGHTLLLIISSVFMLLLSAASIHALFLYVHISYNTILIAHLEVLGREKRRPTYMHFTEAVLAFLSLILCLLGGALIARILHIDSCHDRRDGRLKIPLHALFAIGLIQLWLSVVNAALIVSVKDDASTYQTILAYAVLDLITSFVLCAVQIYICRPSNSHLNCGLILLLLFLICETLTTYNYLSTKTVYVQIFIAYSRMFADMSPQSGAGSSVAKTVLSTFFPIEDMGLLVASHVVQLLQFFLTVFSLLLTGVALEKLYEQRREFNAKTIGGNTAQAAAVEIVSERRHHQQQSNMPSVISYKVPRNVADAQAPKAPRAPSSITVTQAAIDSGQNNNNNSNNGNAVVQQQKLSYDNPVYSDDQHQQQQKRKRLDQQQKQQEEGKASAECGGLLPEEVAPPPYDKAIQQDSANSVDERLIAEEPAEPGGANREES